MTQEERIKAKRDIFHDINICQEKIALANTINTYTTIEEKKRIQKTIDVYEKLQEGLQKEFDLI